MKALLVIGVITAALFSTQASAVTYYGTCPTCTPPMTSVSWHTAAANVAAYYGATTQDDIAMCRNGTGGTMTAAVAQYLVINAPVTGASDVQWNHTQGYVDATCADLGFE